MHARKSPSEAVHIGQAVGHALGHGVETPIVKDDASGTALFGHDKSGCAPRGLAMANEADVQQVGELSLYLGHMSRIF